MAVAAHDGGRSGHAAARARRRRHRLRHHLRRAGSHVAGRRGEQSFRGLDDETRAKLDSLPSNDDVFADAIKHVARRRRPGRRGDAGAALATPKWRCRPASPFAGRIRAPFLVTFPGLLRNMPPIEQAAAGRGLFSINPERDGIVRRVPVVMEAQGTLVPSLTMEMLRVVSQRRRHPGACRPGRRARGGRARPRSADRPQRPVLGPFQQARSGALRVGQGCAARQRAGGPASRPARARSAPRRSGFSTSRPRRSNR